MSDLESRYSPVQMRALALMAASADGRDKAIWPYSLAGDWLFRDAISANHLPQYAPAGVPSPAIDDDLFQALSWLWRRSADRSDRNSLEAAMIISSLLLERLFPEEFPAAEIARETRDFFARHPLDQDRERFLDLARDVSTPLYAALFNVRSKDCVRLIDGALPDTYRRQSGRRRLGRPAHDPAEEHPFGLIAIAEHGP